MPKHSFPIEFGWTLPPGSKTTDKPKNARDVDDTGWMPLGPQFIDRRARWDAEVRRVLNTISGSWASGWITDHFQWDQDDCLEAMSTLAFYAGIFPHLNWGTIVACQGYRNPALMAKMASTIQYLTKGRLILGIGAGWKKDEYLAYGYDFPAPGVRVAQLEETVRIFRAMWDNDTSSFSGAHYKIDNAINLPRTPAPPTLLIGGGGEQKMLPLIARHADWWNSNAQGDDWARKVSILKRESRKAGRDFSKLRLTWFGGATVGDNESVLKRRVRDDFVRNSGLWGTPSQVRAKIKALINAGCTYFLFDSRGIPEDGEIEQLIEISREFAG
jgi:alkanesulfonate monooxygenase SsuD/methylene tetrahydromethanopterin reductase-like flavin-dependent oxidoreductase (luciferase family)